MKKLLLVAMIAGIGLSANAQSHRVLKGYKGIRPLSLVEQYKGLQEKTSPEKSYTKGAPVAKKGPSGQDITTSVSVVDIGQAGNAFGAYSNPRTYLWADPSINTVTYMHRSVIDANAGTPSTGYLVFDVSKDGGASWDINQGPVYTPLGGSPPMDDYAVARYPQGAIYNPPGNTDPNEAYFTYYAALRDTTNPGSEDSDWGGIGYGVYKLSGDQPKTQHHHRSDTSRFKHLIPDAFHVTQTGIVMSAEPSIDLDPAVEEYVDSITISRGVFNSVTNDFDYTFWNIYAPVSVTNGGYKIYADTKMAFAPDGMTGYISIIGHNDFSFKADSGYYPILYKTIDGGLTWNGPINVNIDSIPTIHNIYVDSLGAYDIYSTGFEHDLAVDANGYPHIFTLVTPSLDDWSIYPEIGAMTDIYLTPAGTWDADTVGRIMTYSGTFGSGDNELREWNRAHISTTYDGTKMFYTWFDTDTNSFQDLGNVYPGMWCAGLDIASGTVTPAKNMTVGTTAEVGCTFGSASYYVFDKGNNMYEIPAVYQELDFSGSTVEPTQFYYISGAELQVPFVDNISETKKAQSISVFNSPNPFHGTTIVSLVLNTPSNVNIEVYNAIGQKVMDKNAGKLSSGIHNLPLDASGLNPGVYFYSVKAGDTVITKRMIVQ
jgi:hypothetical protein